MNYLSRNKKNKINKNHYHFENLALLFVITFKSISYTISIAVQLLLISAANYFYYYPHFNTYLFIFLSTVINIKIILKIFTKQIKYNTSIFYPNKVMDFEFKNSRDYVVLDREFTLLKYVMSASIKKNTLTNLYTKSHQPISFKKIETNTQTGFDTKTSCSLTHGLVFDRNLTYKATMSSFQLKTFALAQNMSNWVFSSLYILNFLLIWYLSLVKASSLNPNLNNFLKSHYVDDFYNFCIDNDKNFFEEDNDSYPNVSDVIKENSINFDELLYEPSFSDAQKYVFDNYFLKTSRLGDLKYPRLKADTHCNYNYLGTLYNYDFNRVHLSDPLIYYVHGWWSQPYDIWSILNKINFVLESAVKTVPVV